MRHDLTPTWTQMSCRRHWRKYFNHCIKRMCAELSQCKNGWWFSEYYNHWNAACESLIVVCSKTKYLVKTFALSQLKCRFNHWSPSCQSMSTWALKIFWCDGNTTYCLTFLYSPVPLSVPISLMYLLSSTDFQLDGFQHAIDLSFINPRLPSDGWRHTGSYGIFKHA